MPLKIIAEDILELAVDAIVVPAAPCSGTLSAFSQRLYDEAGYDALMAERRKIGRLPRGSTAVTSGFGLKAKYIIHTAIPSWKYNRSGTASLLADCYRAALKSADEICAGSVAFPLLGAGVNRFPPDIAKKRAENAINAYLEETSSQLIVYLVILPHAAEKLSAQYGEYKLPDEERYRLYEKKYREALKASGLTEDVYDRKRLDSYLKTRIPNHEALADEIDYDKGSLSRFINGRIHAPRKNRVIAIAIAMKLSEEERWEFIRCAGYKYPENDADRYVEELLKSGITDIMTINEKLEKNFPDHALCPMNETVPRKNKTIEK